MTLIEMQDDETWGPLDPGSTLGDAIRRRLADAIFAGTFAVNQRLDEQELADRFGVSRTPVREALRQLAAAGLVEIRPRRGAVVVQADPVRIGQAFEAAAELEALAAGWAAMRANLGEKGELTDACDACERALLTEDAETFAAANRGFHDKIAELAKNESLIAASRLLRVQTAPFQRAQFQSAEVRQRSQAAHREILATICAQDSDGARAAMKNLILRNSLAALRGTANKTDGGGA